MSAVPDMISSDTAEVLQPEPTPNTVAKAATLQEKRNWKVIGGVSAGVTVAITFTILAVNGVKSRADTVDQKQDAAQHDPHSSSHTVLQPKKEIAQMDDLEKKQKDKQRLDYLRTQAQEAHTFLLFYEPANDIPNMQKCLKALQDYVDMQMELHGEPTFQKVNGIVDTLSTEDSVQQDLWERTKSAITRVSLLVENAEKKTGMETVQNP